MKLIVAVILSLSLAGGPADVADHTGPAKASKLSLTLANGFFPCGGGNVNTQTQTSTTPACAPAVLNDSLCDRCAPTGSRFGLTRPRADRR